MVWDTLMKPCMHQAEIRLFSLNNVTVRSTKIMNRANKNWAHFYRKKYFKNQNFQKNILSKVGLQDSSKKYFLGK